MNKIKLFLVMLIISSCSRLPTNQEAKTYGSGDFNFIDQSGEYLLNRKSGLSNGNVVVKSVLRVNDQSKKIVEQVINISERGNLSSKVRILRPKVSEYIVWFDKKKHTTKMSLNIPKKSLDVKIEREGKNTEKRTINFPEGTGVYCFFSQIYECVAETGFFAKAIKRKGGEMNFHVIWDGYPFFQQQYTTISEKIFSFAKLTFDGTNRLTEHRFSLETEGQSIFYFLNYDQHLKKIYWVVQGLKVERMK